MSRTTFEAKLATETAIETFDFTSRLAATETISSASTTATVYSGTDASSSSVISGSATIAGQKITQKVTAGVEGVTYLLTCAITTSLGQTLNLSAFLPIVPAYA